MPLLNPFNINPEIELITESSDSNYIEGNYDRVQTYLNVANWKCPNCGSIVFGRTLVCPFNSKGEYCRTAKP